MSHDTLHRAAPEPAIPVVEGPGLERAITLTDAVVAIAMTVLVLPLVEVAPDVDTGRLGFFLASHRDLLLSFVISFLVIHAFWAAHGTAIRRLVSAEVTVPALRPLNMCWLLVIAFLPFPTAVVGRELTTSSAPLYIGTMVALSTLTSCIVSVVDHHVAPPRHTQWAWLTTGVFAGCALISTVDANLGMLALLLLAAVRVVEVRLLQRRRLTGRIRGDHGVGADVRGVTGGTELATPESAATPVEKVRR